LSFRKGQEDSVEFKLLRMTNPVQIVSFQNGELVLHEEELKKILNQENVKFLPVFLISIIGKIKRQIRALKVIFHCLKFQC